MLSKFMNSNTASTSGSGTLPSGVAYQGPTIPTSLPKVVECETEVTKDTVPPTNNGSTKDVQPSVVEIQPQVPILNPLLLLMDECLALADLGASINLMLLSVWKKLSISELTPTCMTLELVDRSITQPIGIAEDVYLKVRKFKFPADFDTDPQVPLILRRSFLKTGCALIDVYEGELTLRDEKEAVTFNLDQTSRYSSNYDDMTANRMDVIEMD
ncbi:reverse transcriptase domain-containing protein, partial [Tanacetum coccineum]